MKPKYFCFLYGIGFGWSLAAGILNSPMMYIGVGIFVLTMLVEKVKT